MMYTVEVKAIAGWTMHSEHVSYRAAVDQADMVRGRVRCGDGTLDQAAWQAACERHGFAGEYADWRSMDDDERAEYEAGAAG